MKKDNKANDKDKDREKKMLERTRRKPGHASRRPVSRRHKTNVSKLDKTPYTAVDAVKMVQKAKGSKFDESVDVVLKLGIDPRKSDQLVRGSVSLPKGIGKDITVLVFAEGELADKAKEAGADYVGGKELADKILKENWVDFDLVIAHPGMMRFIGRLGKVLGPKGKMPSPKAGTVTADVVSAVTEFKSGRVEYRTDSGGNVHAPIGKKSFSTEDLVENLEALVEHIKSVKPPSSKGTYLQKVVVSSTMGPGVPVEIKR